MFNFLRNIASSTPQPQPVPQADTATGGTTSSRLTWLLGKPEYAELTKIYTMVTAAASKCSRGELGRYAEGKCCGNDGVRSSNSSLGSVSQTSTAEVKTQQEAFVQMVIQHMKPTAVNHHQHRHLTGLSGGEAFRFATCHESGLHHRQHIFCGISGSSLPLQSAVVLLNTYVDGLMTDHCGPFESAPTVQCGSLQELHKLHLVTGATGYRPAMSKGDKQLEGYISKDSDGVLTTHQ